VRRRVLHLADELAAQILGAAARAYPSECCGLIAGTDTGDGWHGLSVHETANIAQDRARHFTIDPQAQFDLMRALRGSERRLIGCFHSHPDCQPEPSATDTANAFERDFLWLIAGGSPDSGFTLLAYTVVEGAGFSPIGLAYDE
jgi:proteasome lid subunit RPN8/RPN11